MARQYETSVAYKYVLYKTKKIVGGGGHDKTRYMGSFDSCIYEIFGVVHFTRKINEAYDNRDVIAAIDRVGVKYLVDIFNNSRLSNIFKEMVDIDYRMKELKKDIRKQSKKGKRDKYSVNEYNYLQKLYKKAGKYLRNKLGIKSARTAYKRRYRAINDAVGSRYYDDEFSSIFMGDGYDFIDDPYDVDDDPYNDDNYDYDESSELEDFARMLHGRSTKPTRRSKRNYDFDDEEYEDEYEDDFDEDDDDPYAKPKRRKKSDDYELDEDYDDRLNQLTDIVINLSENVQALINKDEYIQRNFRPKQPTDVTHLNMTDMNLRSNTVPTSSKNELEVITDFLSKLGDEVNEIKKNNNLMNQALINVINNQREISDTFDSIFEDDDEEESVPVQASNEPDVTFTAPVMERNPLVEMMKNIPDPYEDDDEESGEVETVDPNRMSREELIDKINSSDEVHIKTEEDEKTESK